MPDFKKSSPRPKPYECRASWHLRKSGNLLATYDLVGAVTYGGERSFFGTVANVARYFYPDAKDDAFASAYETVRRDFAVLRKLGWLKMRDDRQQLFVTHEEWEKEHPGQCYKRDLIHWQVNTDHLVGTLYALSDGKLRVMEHHMAGIRKYGSDEEIEAEFKKAMQRSKELRDKGIYSGTSARAMFYNVKKLLEGRHRAKLAAQPELVEK